MQWCCFVPKGRDFKNPAHNCILRCHPPGPRQQITDPLPRWAFHSCFVTCLSTWQVWRLAAVPRLFIGPRTRFTTRTAAQRSITTRGANTGSGTARSWPTYYSPGPARRAALRRPLLPAPPGWYHLFPCSRGVRGSYRPSSRFKALLSHAQPPCSPSSTTRSVQKRLGVLNRCANLNYLNLRPCLL